jgi:nitroimidazol reductase NimA-like FMN-containing flavoprotein (pyridoxamine 5'-phosphate oxidase superfamily)
MISKLNSGEIEEMLNHQSVGRIGCHADGITYVVPISYAYKDDCIYGRTMEGMKVAMMRKNPQVCFEVDHMKDMANWKSVIAWGKFEELHDKAERDKALQCLVDRMLPLISSSTTHLSPEWPFPLNDISSIEGIVFRITLSDKTGRFETDEVIADSLPG